MNKITKNMFVPLLVGSIYGLYLLINNLVQWTTPLWFYMFFGVFVNGTIAHRYFCHGSFEIPNWLRKFFAYLVVLGAYSSPLVWVVQHRHHHINSDKSDDMHSPIHGFWHSFAGWRMIGEINLRNCASRRVLQKYLKDPSLYWTTKYYYQIFWSWMLIIGLFDLQLLCAGYCVGMMIEFLRVGLINTVCHMPGLIGNYSSYDNKDFSQNNLFLGWFGGGFGWHNNHHASPSKLILQNRWWEIDLEGYFGWILSKLFSQQRSINA